MDAAKIFITAGILLIIIGICIAAADKIPWLGKLPGDIVIRKENYSFYFPLATCLIFSIVISIILYFWNQR